MCNSYILYLKVVVPTIVVARCPLPSSAGRAEVMR
jgi:hypothetical protein